MEKLKDCKEALALYAVTDRAWLGGTSLAEQVEEAILGGATFIQLREKNMAYEDFVTEAREIKKVTDRHQIPFVINDDVAVALAVDADGVHLGQGDEAITAARKELGPHKIIGISAHTVPLALAAEQNGADYIGVGAVFPTVTKDDAEAVPPEELKAICQAVHIPVVAIGGITKDTLSALKGSGIDGIAVVSAIFAAADIRSAARELADGVKELLKRF